MSSSSTLTTDEKKSTQSSSQKSNVQITSRDPIQKSLDTLYQSEEKSHIKRLFYEKNPFPIEKSYINLALVKQEEQKKKEMNLDEKNNSDKESKVNSNDFRQNEYLSSYEVLHATKERIELENIFKKQKNETSDPKKILILGRAGIGKTTLFQYIAHQWSKNVLLVDCFDYVFWLPLSNLKNIERILEKKIDNLSIGYIIKHLLFSTQTNITTGKLDDLFKKHKARILLLLDGFDEISEHYHQKNQVISHAMKHFLEFPQYMLTSRPHYIENFRVDRELAIVGFTNENIKNYIQSFFVSLKKEELAEGLLTKLYENPSTWGAAYVPINLELICSLWEKEKGNVLITSSLTLLYNQITKLLFQRYLREQCNFTQQDMSNEKTISKILPPLETFMESLAWEGMKSARILISPEAITRIKAYYKEKKEEDKMPEFSEVLKTGFINTVNMDTTTIEEIDKRYYFIHLTFQEFFAARYLINGLKQPTDSKRHQAALQFLREEKYNPRYQIVLGFMAGLLNAEPECMVQQEEKQNTSKKAAKKITILQLFWNTLLSPPLDIYGAGHLRLIMRCLEEAQCDSRIPLRNIILSDIRQWFKAIIYDMELCYKGDWLIHLLSVFPRVLHVSDCLEIALQSLCDKKDNDLRMWAVYTLTQLSQQANSEKVLPALLQALEDKEEDVQVGAAEVLGWLDGEKVVDSLLQVLGDKSTKLRETLALALGGLGIKTASEKVVNSLLQMLSDKKKSVRESAAYGLGWLHEKGVSEKVVDALLQALRDKKKDVRKSAAEALGRLGEKTTGEKIVIALLQVLEDKEDFVRSYAVLALGQLGEKATSEKVVAALLQGLGSKDKDVRARAAEALGQLGEKAASEKVVVALFEAMGDKDELVRVDAAAALGNLGEKAASEKMVATLLQALEDKESDTVRSKAAEALGKLGEKFASEKVVTALLQALGGSEWGVGGSAAAALGRLGQKVASEKVVAALFQALEDKENYGVPREVEEALGGLCSVMQLIQLYPKLAQCKGYRKFLRNHIFKSAVTMTFIDPCLVVWEGQKQSIVKNLSKDQVRELAEWLTVIFDNQHLPTPHLSYGLSLDISINKNQNSNPVFISELYVKQAVKIQLNYSDDACKRAPFDVLSAVLKTLDHEHLHYLDLSDNQLIDEVASTLAVRYIAKGKWPHLRTLKLSNNQLSLTGLGYLLKELSANSSLKFLDVDQNHIACESKQFQEKLEPLIKKAQLERLDLSLNFIDKGELVQSNGRRLVLDKQIVKPKIEEEKRICIKSFLSHSFIVQSNTGVIKSLLDPGLELSRSHGVIALMANKTSNALSTKEHAFMALEYMHHFGQRTIIVGELFNKEGTKKIIINLHYETPQYFLKRTQGYGEVSSTSQKNKEEQKQTDKNDANEKVYKRTGLFEKGTIKQVIKEMIKSSNEKGFYDYGVVFVSGANELNCIKWALGMLNKGAGIPIPDKWQVPSWMVNPESGRCLVM